MAGVILLVYKYNFGRTLGELNMKFVTVMDMWLLIINLGLMGAILYYGRRLVKLIARVTNNMDASAVEKERVWIINMLTEERDNLLHMQSVENVNNYDDEIGMLDDLIEKVRKRGKK